MFLAILGKKGSGKSYLTKKLLKNISGKTIILDPMNEYSFGKIYDDPNMFYKAICSSSKFVRMLSKNDEQNEIIFEILLNFKNLNIVIDEFHLYCNSYTKKSKIIEIVRTCRHNKHNIIIVTQRIQDIPRNVISQADQILSFNQSDIRDIKYLSELGFNGKQLEKLEQYHFLSLKF